jgi:hypothetical protein
MFLFGVVNASNTETIDSIKVKPRLNTPEISVFTISPNPK